MPADDQPISKPFRWHILVFLAPAFLVYTAFMILPLFGTLQLSLFRTVDRELVFVGLENFHTLFFDERWSVGFWNALWNNCWFFIIHMIVQNPIGILLAAILASPRLRFAAIYRTAIFIPTILSFVIVGFVWKLILSRGTPNLENETWVESANVINGTDTPEVAGEKLQKGLDTWYKPAQ